MAISYVHDELLLSKIADKKEAHSADYDTFRRTKYLPMRKKVRRIDFETDPHAYEKCARILNDYYQEILNFKTRFSVSKKSKLHTSFLEEFSCYFFWKLEGYRDFDVFKSGVFAGLKMNADQTVSVITKDVDFCIGKVIKAKFGNQKLVLKIPIICVEAKSYTEKTMLGEIVNTARKLKGANPQSKAILLTWVNSFTSDSALEVACESSLDEIVVMSEERRADGYTPIVFTEDGLKDYYEVVSGAFKEALLEYEMPTVGRLISYAKVLTT